jgi:hypothetical protein
MGQPKHGWISDFFREFGVLQAPVARSSDGWWRLDKSRQSGARSFLEEATAWATHTLRM